MSLLSEAIAAYIGQVRDGTQLYDSSPVGRHGTISGGPAWVFDETIGRYCLDTDGVDDHAFSPDWGGPAPNVYTMSAWVYPRSLPTTGQDGVRSGQFATFGESPGAIVADRSIGYRLTGKATAYVFSGGARNSDAAALILNQWQHIAGVKTSTHLLCYLDGSPGTPTPAGDPYTGYTTPQLIIGRTNNGYTNYKVADVCVWPRALTAAEISRLADPGYSLLATGPALRSPHVLNYLDPSAVLSSPYLIGSLR